MHTLADVLMYEFRGWIKTSKLAGEDDNMAASMGVNWETNWIYDH